MRSKRIHRQRSRWMPILLGTIGGTIVSLSLSQPAPADSISGRVQLTYSHSETRDQSLTQPLQPADDSESRVFVQQYNLSLDKSIYPNLKFSASGMFQKSDFVSSFNGQRNDTTSILTRPYVDLSLRTPLYLIDANYNSAITETKTNTGLSTTLIHDAYTGTLGWNPVELPTAFLTASRSHDYDKDYAFTDRVSDTITLSSNYYPWRSVQLRYQGNYLDSQDKKLDLESRVTGQDGRVMYNDQFFHDRLSISGYYDYGYRTTETSTSGRGNVNVQLLTVDGLLASSNIPSTVRLSSAPFLIDTITTGPQNPTNNIGTDTFPLDTTPRNLGLQFSVATELNTLDVWVYSLSGATLATAIPTYLQTAVASSFTWAVYTSSDNQNWALYQTGASAPYDIDVTNLGVGRFVITFPNVTTRYVKVVVSPLLPPVAGGPTQNFPGVYVTEVQAFIAVSAATVQGKTRTTSQLVNVNTSVKVLQTALTSLYYDLTYFSNTAGTGFSTTRSSTVSNALSLTHRFSAALSGSTRVARTDQTDPTGTAVFDELNAQIYVVPIRTLSHSLGYSASTRLSQNGQRSSNEALFMANTAELYKGVTAFLNGGLSTVTSETDLKNYSANYTWGVNLIPIKTLNITLSSFTEKAEQSGPGATPGSTRTKSSIASVAYYPYSLLYLAASWQKFTTNERSNTIKNYGLNWSPLPGGNLLFNLSYSETLQTQDNSIDKSITPSARWNIARGTYLTAAYASTTNTSDFHKATSRLYSATLNVAL